MNRLRLRLSVRTNIRTKTRKKLLKNDRIAKKYFRFPTAAPEQTH
jgi:hypothetical protein